MKRAFRQIAVLAALLLLLFGVARLAFFQDYTLAVRVNHDPDELSIDVENPEVIRIGIDRLGSDNTFEREPAPWIITGRIEKE